MAGIRSERGLDLDALTAPVQQTRHQHHEDDSDGTTNSWDETTDDDEEKDDAADHAQAPTNHGRARQLPSATQLVSDHPEGSLAINRMNEHPYAIDESLAQGAHPPDEPAKANNLDISTDGDSSDYDGEEEGAAGDSGPPALVSRAKTTTLNPLRDAYADTDSAIRQKHSSTTVSQPDYAGIPAVVPLVSASETIKRSAAAVGPHNYVDSSTNEFKQKTQKVRHHNADTTKYAVNDAKHRPQEISHDAGRLSARGHGTMLHDENDAVPPAHSAWNSSATDDATHAKAKLHASTDDDVDIIPTLSGRAEGRSFSTRQHREQRRQSRRDLGKNRDVAGGKCMSSCEQDSPTSIALDFEPANTIKQLRDAEDEHPSAAESALLQVENCSRFAVARFFRLLRTAINIALVFVFEMLRFGLTLLTKILVEVINVTSHTLLKPLLNTIFNQLCQPVFVVLKETSEALKLILQPFFMAFYPAADLIAKVLRAFQPVVINRNSKSSDIESV